MKISNLFNRQDRAQDSIPAKEVQNKKTNLFQKAKKTESIESSDLDSKKSNLNVSIKNTNNAISALEVMIDSIKSLQGYAKDYLKIAQNIEKNKDSRDDEFNDLINQETQLKSKLNATIDSANFQNENVFRKNYKSLDLTLDATKAIPTNLKPESSSAKLYLNNLNEQKQQAESSKKILQKRVEDDLDNEYGSTMGDFNNLDSKKVKNEQFKTAHNTESLSSTKVKKLLSD